MIDLESLQFRIQRRFDILKLQAFAKPKRLAKQGDRALRGDEPNEGHLPRRNRQMCEIKREVGREFPELFASAILGGSSSPKMPIHMVLIDRCHQASKFAADITRPSKWAVPENRLKPPIKVFH